MSFDKLMLTKKHFGYKMTVSSVLVKVIHLIQFFMQAYFVRATKLYKRKKAGDTLIQLIRKSSQPIYSQIIEQYKYMLIQGFLKKGDMIPSVRKLALDLSVTPGTVAKAYSELERQGIIETVRGKGTFVAGIPEVTPDKGAIGKVKENLKKECMELIYLGLGKEEVLKMVEEIYDKIKEGECVHG